MQAKDYGVQSPHHSRTILTPLPHPHISIHRRGRSGARSLGTGCLRAAGRPDEIGKAATRASTPSVKASSFWTPDSTCCFSREKSCLRFYMTPRAQQQGLGSREVIPTLRFFFPESAGMRNRWTDGQVGEGSIFPS